MSRTNRQKFFVLLFLFHFMSYAASPLSYNFTGHHTSENLSSPGKASLPGKSIHIFLWELICAQFSVANNAATADSTIRILIKKARAIIPQNISALLTPSGERAMSIAICFILLLLSAAPLQHNCNSHIVEGFSLLCGDRSPPYR